MKKSQVIAIILLFIGVAIAPSINLSAVKASNDNDLVEVTTQACGIQGYGNTTVKLTKEQYQDLERYLVEFRARLNQTTTREEAVPIFKEAVVELNKYGLLPRGMSVENTQKLVIGPDQNQRLIKFFEKLYNLNQNSINSNFLCLTTGQGSNIIYYRPVFGSIAYFYAIIGQFVLPGNIFTILALFFDEINFYYTFHYPLKFLSFIGFGSDHAFEGRHHYYPYHGNLFTVGLFGIKNWNGSFNGGITKFDFAFATDYIGYYIGGVGFCGINIVSNGNVFFLGTSLYVKISPIP